jgi:hypothetical protein
VERITPLLALPVTAAPAFDLQAAMGILKVFPALVASASAEGLRDMLRAVFSHVWAEGKQIAAATPKGVYLPFLVTV